MSTLTTRLEAGGLLPAGSRADVDSGATEEVVARTYRHPALGERPVIRLASDRLGEAEDLAMEFLGFGAPGVSGPIGVQQRRSLGFAAWALINDPGNARYALDLVKRMKAAARQARSKPGHAWDAYTAMAKDLGRSARHFLPPFWEEAGRAFKDLGNPTYAGRALTKSLEAERVHALPADRARRRDVVLEFVLSGCLGGSALSDYGDDLLAQYPPAEAFAIFRDLCVRRTRGGMSPWATMPKDFGKLAKAAGLDAGKELEGWLEEVVDAPAMGRPPLQFWKSCAAQCKRIAARSPAFAVALLRHTRPEPRFYGESKLGPWLDLIREWGVLEHLWEDGRDGAPPLGEPIAEWFGRIVRDELPAPRRTLELLEKLAPRLRKEGVPLALSERTHYRENDVDVDVLEACLALGIKVADPLPATSVSFSGWLAADPDHPLRNQDVAKAAADERFRPAVVRALDEALTCRGGSASRGYGRADMEQRAFPLAAGDRPGILSLWREHAAEIVGELEQGAGPGFEVARRRLESTLWPDTLRLFPDLAERLRLVDPAATLQRTLRAGVFDEYGLPALEATADRLGVGIKHEYLDANIHLAYPYVALSNKTQAHVVGGDGRVREHELRLPKKARLTGLMPVGDDVAVVYRNEKHEGRFHWAGTPSQAYEASAYGYYHQDVRAAAVPWGDGWFLGRRVVRTGDKEPPQTQAFFHDRERFWRLEVDYDSTTHDRTCKLMEIDPLSGKDVRASVPAWFEDAEGGVVVPEGSELIPAPEGAADSPLGARGGMLGWKVVKRRDGGYSGVGVDGRRWDRPFPSRDGTTPVPWGLLKQPGTDEYLPVTGNGDRGGVYQLWDPAGTSVVALLGDFNREYARGQAALLPITFWHLLKVRDEASSRRLREIGLDECAALLRAAKEDREAATAPRRGSGEAAENPLTSLLAAVRELLPSAPERLAIGVARVVETAEKEAAEFAALREKAIADSAETHGGAAVASYRKSDLAAARWGLVKYHDYGEDGEASISAHLLAAVEFLKGGSKAGGLPKAGYLWFPLLEKLPLRCWQVYWSAAAAKLGGKEGGETPWLEFLKLWNDLGIDELPGRFDIMEGHPEGAKKRKWGGFDVDVNGGDSFAVENGEDRFVVIEHQSYGDDMPYQFLRYSTAQEPAPPPGYKVRNVRAVKAKGDRAAIAAFIAAVEASPEPPLPTRPELQEVADRLGVTPAEVGLVWLGGLNLDSYDHNFLPAGLRNALGWKAAEAAVARQALRNLGDPVLERLYESVVALGPGAPFEADRGPVLRRVEEAWRGKTPRRLQLDATLQARLSSLGRSSRWHQVDNGALMAAAADPAAHPKLQPMESGIGTEKGAAGLTILATGKGKGEPVDDGFLRSLVQLTSLVHAETPAGHPARAAFPAVVDQALKLLDHAGTLLGLRTLYIYDAGDKKTAPTEWLDKHVGKTKADAKGGVAHVDDGLVVAAAIDAQRQALVAFRPSQLRDERDLARLQGLLAIDVQVGYETSSSALPTVAAIKSPGFRKLAEAVLAAGLPEGRSPQDPTLTAPGVVEAIRKQYDLGADAAVLYAQLLALPEPTAANVRAWNGWTAARYKKAADELAGRKLVLEATRARAGRAIFLPGEWVELKAPWLPIERWKLDHLAEPEFKLADPCPAGGPMVLRPFGDLFAAAWKRVEGGDEPRYEEVQRKKTK